MERKVLSAAGMFNKLHEDFKAIPDHRTNKKNIKTSLADTASIVLSWFIVESIIQKIWESWLNSKNHILPDNSKRISSQRLDNLTGRDYPMSVKLN